MPARKKPSEDAAAPVTRRRTKKTSPSTTAPKAAVTRQRTRTAPAARAKEAGKHDLVIVESPAKARTINKYLGTGFKVLASYGHVRDLPKRRRKGEQVAGVNIQAGWVPTYVVGEQDDGRPNRRSPRDILAELKREAAKAGRVFLATDPDREGEAIAWHIEDELGLEDARTFRITFNEITRSAVQGALAHPGKIDMDRVKAQEARRVLDRVVGYPLSNLISKKVARALSAGRVQSVALRLVVEREREIEKFKPQEFWKITALLAPLGTVPFTFKPFSVVEARNKPATEPAGSDGEPGTLVAGVSKEEAGLPEVPAGAFLAELAEWAGQKFEAANGQAATEAAAALDTAAYEVTKVEQKDRPEKAPPPFTTSTLQQQASIRLRFKAELTMKIAQKLYEGVDLGREGSVALITYMRTDSTRVSNEALQAVRDHIHTTFGPPYLPPKPNYYASGKSAQEAHEAIRPTDVANTPQRVAALGLHGDPLRLYTLIYNRFVASQMMPAVFAITNVEVTATPTGEDAETRRHGDAETPRHGDAEIPRHGDTETKEAVADAPPSPQLSPRLRVSVSPRLPSGLFKAQGKVLKFDGYRKVLPTHKQEDALLPPLSNQQKLDRLDLIASQHFTQPPPRYNEASLVRALEKEGIGRPSTYASILGKITSDRRGYIEVKERRFYATELGKLVTDLLVEHFPRVMDLKFTSHMEEELDQIETRKTHYVEVLNEFWGPFSEALHKAEATMPHTRGRETGEMCPRCGRPLVVNYSKKRGREFVGCSGFKEGCKYIKPANGQEEAPEPEVTDIPCPTCGKPMQKRTGPRGPFLGCSSYPDCQTKMVFDAQGQPVLAARPTDHKCAKCGRPMVIREGRRGPFLACTGYPKCKNAMDVDAQGNPVKPIDTGVKCDKCGSPMVVRRGPRGPFLGCSAFPRCRSHKQLPEELKEKIKDTMPAPAKKAMPAVEVKETCPECGAPMKLRQARFGRGGYFLGCGKYPKCKGKRDASPDLLEQLQTENPG